MSNLSFDLRCHKTMCSTGNRKVFQILSLQRKPKPKTKTKTYPKSSSIRLNWYRQTTRKTVQLPIPNTISTIQFCTWTRKSKCVRKKFVAQMWFVRGNQQSVGSVAFSQIDERNCRVALLRIQWGRKVTVAAAVSSSIRMLSDKWRVLSKCTTRETRKFN